MSTEKQSLSLDQQVTYQIKVPGVLDKERAYLNDDVEVCIDFDRDNLPTTTLTGRFDQASLQGILRRLYGLGLSLISVNSLTMSSFRSLVRQLT